VSPRITVLIPAPDESEWITATLAGLRRQTLPPNRVIVVADNCSDDTVALARAAGAEVYETVGNRDKKAGALNQAWRERFRRTTSGPRRTTERRGPDRRRNGGAVAGPERRGPDRRGTDRRASGEWRSEFAPLPDAADTDLVLGQDVDSQLDEGFLAGAAPHVLGDDSMGAVGGTFRGDRGGGLVGHLQRNEYARYARDMRRLKREVPGGHRDGGVGGAGGVEECGHHRPATDGAKRDAHLLRGRHPGREQHRADAGQ
jgi:cellulose synthase/poly-beta-1,6-N-acetylglucosamine synthase-like glycosyltransferase